MDFIIRLNFKAAAQNCGQPFFGEKEAPVGAVLPPDYKV